MRVEEIVSPSASTSGTILVSNSSRSESISGVPFALAPKRKFSPIETCVAPSLPTRMSSMNSSAGICENALSNGITTSSETPRPAITSRLA